MLLDNHEETTMDLPAGLSEIYEDSLENENITLTEEGTVEQNQMKYPIEVCVLTFMWNFEVMN